MPSVKSRLSISNASASRTSRREMIYRTSRLGMSEFRNDEKRPAMAMLGPT